MIIYGVVSFNSKGDKELLNFATGITEENAPVRFSSHTGCVLIKASVRDHVYSDLYELFQNAAYAAAWKYLTCAAQSIETLRTIQ